MISSARFLQHCSRLRFSSFLNESNYDKILQNTIRTAAHRTNYEMNKVYLRNFADSQELHISFHYTNPDYRVDRDFNFCRDINENVSVALLRIRNNVEKEVNKRLKKTKQKNKKATAEVPESQSSIDVEDLKIEFVCNGNDANLGNITFAEMLKYDGDLQLKIIDETFEVLLNQPWVLKLVLPSSLLAGYMVYPSKVEMQFSDRAFCRGLWYKAKMPSSGDLQRGAEWIECGSGFFYTTTNEDIGYYLKFVLIPSNSTGICGPAVEAISKKAVEAGPGQCPFETRHCFTSDKLSGDSFRVVSYNLLADLYADSDYSRTQLFPYCPPYALAIDYRKQLFIKEIVGYNADIICLQEVDMRIFDSDLKGVFESPELNYTGVIEQKGSCGEGVSMFFRNDRFELVKNYGLNLGQNIQILPEFNDLWQKIKDNTKLVERICDRSTTVQLCLLKSKDNGRYLVVANTHLYFHPDADHIRLLQIGFAMIYVNHIIQSTKAELNITDDKDISLIFCGDFNSVPECGIYKLMTEKFVPDDFVDWRSNEVEAVKNVSLTQPFDIKSACGTPQYTNYTHLFAACLDYIFYQCDNLELQQVIPLPTEDELKFYTAIPSVVFPSDHVALVADLRYK